MAATKRVSPAKKKVSGAKVAPAGKAVQLTALFEDLERTIITLRKENEMLRETVRALTTEVFELKNAPQLEDVDRKRRRAESDASRARRKKEMDDYEAYHAARYMGKAAWTGTKAVGNAAWWIGKGAATGAANGAIWLKDNYGKGMWWFPTVNQKGEEILVPASQQTGSPLKVPKK